MRLFIAEKPSLGKAVASCLPEPHKIEDGFIRCGDSDIVTWCIGHIMEHVNPDEYDEKYKKWDIDDLPIIPEKWKYKITHQKQFNIIKKLAKECSEICHTGDPDEEGQILVDEVLDYIGVKENIKRILISDVNEKAIKKQLNNIVDNTKYRSMGESALARSRSDWLYGMNFTRLYTILSQNNGYKGVLSVGRCQTPLLSLIVSRHNNITNFKSKPFYEIEGICSIESGEFKAYWKPDNYDSPDFDDEKRLINKKLATEIVNRISGQEGEVSECTRESKKTPPPKMFSLADLSSEVARIYDYDATKTLKIVQSLYETHKIVTYPRSDCSFLPEEHYDDREQVINTIKRESSDLSEYIDRCDLTLKSNAWNDKKITAHHAIIPTTITKKCTLTKEEQQIFDIISRRYLAHFYPDKITDVTNIHVNVNEDNLECTGKIITNPGWEALYKEKSNNCSESLPDVSKGNKVSIKKCNIINKKTTPPKYFTNETIIKAMSGISRYVTDPEIKKLLSDVDGIGTPATYPKLIKTLFDRKYAEKKGRNIIPTDIGISFISSLPEEITLPDMTARWAKRLKLIVKGEIGAEEFVSDVKEYVTKEIDKGKEKYDFKITESSILCPKCNKPVKRIKKPGKDAFWVHVDSIDSESCQRYLSDHKNKPVLKKPDISCPKCNNPVKVIKKPGKDAFWVHVNEEHAKGCKKYISDLKGKPFLKKEEEEIPCPKCSKGVKRLERSDKTGHFWVHKDSINANKCTKYLSDKEGKPAA